MTLFKNLLLSCIAIGGVSASSMAMADDFGCKAVLCFAGGKGLSECASTISEVKKRLAKGKGFPYCSFASPSGSQQEIVKQSKTYTRQVIGKTCPDGVTAPKYILRNRYCTGIQVTFVGANPKGGDLTQDINW